MKRPEPDSPAAQVRAQAAAEWLVRRDRGLTASEQDEFLQWLAADPRHGEWFALHRHTVRDFGALAQWRPEHSEEPNADLLAPPRVQIRRWIPWVCAAAALLLLAGSWRHVLRSPIAAEQAVAQEFERRILEDGSAVELNRGAVVTVAFTATERRASLVRGEALFIPATNVARPFVVSAGGIDVRAIGTAFSVRLEPTAVEVLVTEGKVAVMHALGKQRFGAPSANVTSAASAPLKAEVHAGERATVARDGSTPPRVVSVAPQTVAQLLAWQPQMLDFSSAPLSAAIAEFNRRNRVQFVLTDPELAALPVVAAIRSDNVEGFAHFLAGTPGLRVERRNDHEIIIGRKD